MSAEYQAAVDARLRSVLARARDWPAILARMQGADPVLVAERLRQLAPGIPIEARDPRPSIQWAPELHPLRAEWYFTAATASALSRRFAGPRL